MFVRNGKIAQDTETNYIKQMSTQLHTNKYSQ